MITIIAVSILLLILFAPIIIEAVVKALKMPEAVEENEAIATMTAGSTVYHTPEELEG